MLQKRLSLPYKIISKKLNIDCTGLDNIDINKNYIFAMNHQSFIDVPIAFSILAPVLKRKLILYLSRNFYYPFYPLAKPLGVISVSMNKDKKRCRRFNGKQLKKGMSNLRSGNNVLIYPEGIIYGGRYNQLLRGETGVIRLALQSETPIIPIGASGSNKVYPLLVGSKNPVRIRPKNPVKIKFGDPISFKNYYGINLDEYSDDNKRLLRQLTDDLMGVLSDLSGLKMRSVRH